jgi:hypothetical protein
MMSIRAISFVLSFSMAATAPAWAAQAAKPEAKKPEAKAKRQPPGRTETLACRLGTEDRHARIAVVVIKGRTDSFAYYSKWKPRTCSVYLQRNRDTYSKWADSGNITTVNLEKGAFLIEHKPGEYHFIFRDIDRERYCGMDGVINGSLTIKRGSEQCILEGDIMVEGTALGEANVAREERAPPALLTDVDKTQTDAAAPAPALQEKPQAAQPAAKPAPGQTERKSEPAQAQRKPEPVQAESKPVAEPQAQPAAAQTPALPAAAPAPQAVGASPATTQETTSKPAAAAAAQPQTQKPTEASSGNPFSAFFRSIKPGTPPEATSP